MSDNHKKLIAAGAMSLVLAIPMLGHADPAKPASVAAANTRAENGVALALSGQNLLTERQTQTRGLEAERRALLSRPGHPTT